MAGLDQGLTRPSTSSFPVQEKTWLRGATPRMTEACTMPQSTFEFVRDNIAATPFHQWLLPELVEVNEKEESVTIRLPIRPEFCRLPGRPELHGAIVAAMVDITGHAAIAAKVLHTVATVDMRVDYLRLAGGTELISVANVVKLGRTIGVVDVRIRDDQRRLVAIGRAAYVTASV